MKFFWAQAGALVWSPSLSAWLQSPVRRPPTTILCYAARVEKINPFWRGGWIHLAVHEYPQEPRHEIAKQIQYNIDRSKMKQTYM